MSVQLFSFLSSGFEELIPFRVTSISAVLGIDRRVAQSNLSTSRAQRLRARFRSCPMFEKTTRFQWVTSWPGMSRGIGLAFSLPSALPPLSWADLLNDTFAEWEDLQVYDESGLAGFAVRHERLIATRAPTPTSVGTFRAEPPSGDLLDQQLVDFLVRSA